MKVLLNVSLCLALVAPAWADPGQHADLHPGMHHELTPVQRVAVNFPPALRAETLANMRDHLRAIQEITAYLADKRFDAAADVAESRLGLSSLQGHGAHAVAQYMPEAMRQIGHGMHQAASRFALTAQESGATGDVAPALRALAQMQDSCIACHAGFELK